MKIKAVGARRSSLEPFDLLGRDEVALAKAFAYLIGCERAVLAEFLRRVGVRFRSTAAQFDNVDVHIERRREEGRTDIELWAPGKFHVIVECKVRGNRIKSQRTQYVNALRAEPQRALCFVTQERDQNLERTAGVLTTSLGWLDILEMLEDRQLSGLTLVQDFARFATKGFKMRLQKEVLIQDLAKEGEVRRYLEHRVYRREPTYGTPLYFAPYLTRSTLKIAGMGLREGISHLSKVLGVLTVKGADVESYLDELVTFADGDKAAVQVWLGGVDIGAEEDSTYYFLGPPVTFPRPLLKDGGIEPGRGKGWIAAKIPKNRCVTFEQFSKRMVAAFT